MHGLEKVRCNMPPTRHVSALSSSPLTRCLVQQCIRMLVLNRGNYPMAIMRSSYRRAPRPYPPLHTPCPPNASPF